MADETLEWDLKVDADTSGGMKMDAVLGKVERTAGALHSKVAGLEQGSGEHMRRMGGHAETLEHKIRHEFGGIGHSVQYVKNELHDLAEFTGALLLAETIEKIADKVFELGKEMVRAAADAERFDIAFSNALGAEDAEATLGYIEKIGHHTEFTQNKLKGMNLELAKSGFHGADLARANEAAIDLASMSANPEEGAGMAVGALKRLMTSGKLDARALRPFGISTKDFFGELSKETGVGVATLQKQMQKGKVDVGASLNSLYTVITNKTGKALGGAGADMEKTLNVRLKNLKEIPELIGEKMRGTKGFAAISDFIGKLGDQFSPDGPLGKKIFAGMESIVDTIGEQLQGIDLKEVATTITDDIIPAVKAMAASILFVVDALERVIRGFHRMKVLVAGPDFEEGPAVAAKRAERREKNKVEAAFPEKKVETATAKIHHGQFHMVGGDEAEGLKKALPAFNEAGAEAGAETEKGFRKKTKTHSPSEVFRDVGEDLAAGVGAGVEKGTARVDAAFARMMQVASDDDPEAAIERAMARLSQPSSTSGSTMGSGAPAGTAVQVTVQPTIRIDGAGMSADEIADAVQEKLTEIVPGALQSALEQVAMQTGSAT